MANNLMTRRRALLKDVTSVIPPEPGGDPWYGVDWFYSNSSPQLTRVGAAANFSDPQPATSVAGAGSSPFDGIMPWAGMKRYNIINGAVSYSEDDAGFSQTDYDTVVYIPEFYYRAEKDTTDQVWSWAISPTAQEGFEKHPGSGRYIGRYHTSGSAEGVYSKSGALPLVSTTRPDFRTYSHAKGSNWWMLDFATWSAVQLLYLVEFAHFGSQTTLGTGYVDKSAVGAGGGTDDAAYHTLKISGDHNQYRWIEDPFSNCRDWVDGFVSYGRVAYIETVPSKYSDSRTGLVDTGIKLPSPAAIRGFGYSDKAPWAFIPDTASGTTDNAKYVTDYVSSSTGTNALFVGGYYTSSANYGMFYVVTNVSASSTYAYLGTRLLYIP